MAKTKYPIHLSPRTNPTQLINHPAQKNINPPKTETKKTPELGALLRPPPLTESAGIIIANGLGVTEGFKDGVAPQQDVLHVLSRRGRAEVGDARRALAVWHTCSKGKIKREERQGRHTHAQTGRPGDLVVTFECR